MNDFISEFVSEHSDIPIEYALAGSSLRKLIAVYAAQEIAAAVAAEREACAKVAEEMSPRLAGEQIQLSNIHGNKIAAAIRTRNGSKS